MSSFNEFYNIYKSSCGYAGQDYSDAYTTMNEQAPRVIHQSVRRISTESKIFPQKSSDCIIVIPVYKKFPDAFEKRNLLNTKEKLSKDFDICLVCPKLLSMTAYKEILGPEVKIVRLSGRNFTSKETYSNMMLSPEFYDIFARWKYMLVVQADVWIFGNAVLLKKYINMGFTYLGGAWTEEYCKSIGIEDKAVCGNGGLSLRKTVDIAEILRHDASLVPERLKTVEDQFMTYMLNLNDLCCDSRIAVGFSIDNEPGYWHSKLCSSENIPGELPFGVHMGKTEFREYWEPFICDQVGVDQDSPTGNLPPIVVSLTSFGDRLRCDAPNVINNMLNRQLMRPQKVVLTIYKEDEDNIPISLKRLEEEKRLVILRSETNLRPHLKYFETMKKYRNEIIITVDDDEDYPIDLIYSLVNKWKSYKDCVVAGRCHMIKYDGTGSPLPYKHWDMETSSAEYPSDSLFATGVGGVLYPPGCFDPEWFDMNEIMSMVTADDIYLKMLEQRHNIPVVGSYRGRPKRLRYTNTRTAIAQRLCDTNTEGPNINDQILRRGVIDRKQRKVCYTVITGNYDILKQPRVLTPGWEYICFTD